MIATRAAAEPSGQRPTTLASLATLASRASQGHRIASDDELDRMLLDNPAVPITKPRSTMRAKAKPQTPTPGSIVSDRRCRIVFKPDTGWYILTFLPDPSQQPAQATMPRRVLPCKWLEAVDRELEGSKSGVFEVSGETTVYKGRAFILLRSVKTKRKGRPAAKAPTTRPAATLPAKAPETESSADDILAAMLRKRPGRPVSVVDDSELILPAPSVAPIAGRPQLDEDRGNMRIDRLVTIAKSADHEWFEARFESDNTLQEQPVRLLPCKKLEEAERGAIRPGFRRRIVRMRITGELTHYKNHRYMLLRKVIRHRDMGQF